jgi:ABC-type molybdate transport system substrate-binding protein
MVTVFAIGTWVGGKNREAAKMLVKFLRSPEAAAMFKARGLDPL